MGLVSSVNAKGDPCDNFFNIFLQPLFVNPTTGDFNLQSTSPCIDAGNPDDPRDPDGTIADMGARYFHQASAGPLSLTLTPINPPVSLPAGGGSFQFDATIENTSGDPITFDAWTELILPSGNVYGPLIQRNGLVIPAGATILRQLNQFVPSNAPPGSYSMVGNAGLYPDSVIASDNFPFTKMPGDGAPNHNEGWACYGWNDDEEGFRIQDSGFGILSVNPNPFNPSTALSFELQAAGNVSLAIYDIAGREVTVLAEGWYPAGSYRFNWNASSMASGVYFARLTACGEDNTLKMLLVK